MNLSKIDLNLLVTFETLISEGSVSRTAQKLGVTQPAVSHSLKRLRDLSGDESAGARPARIAADQARAVASSAGPVRAGGHPFDPEHHGTSSIRRHTSHIPAVDERRHERRGAAVDRAPYPSATHPISTWPSAPAVRRNPISALPTMTSIWRSAFFRMCQKSCSAASSIATR